VLAEGTEIVEGKCQATFGDDAVLAVSAHPEQEPQPSIKPDGERVGGIHLDMIAPGSRTSRLPRPVTTRSRVTLTISPQPDLAAEAASNAGSQA